MEPKIYVPAEPVDWQQRAEVMYFIFNQTANVMGLPGVSWKDVDFFPKLASYDHERVLAFIAEYEKLIAEIDAESEKVHPGRADQVQAALRDGNMEDPAIQAVLKELSEVLGEEEE